MNDLITKIANNPIISLVGLIASLITIYTFFKVLKKIKNKVSNSEIGGDFVGGDRGGANSENIDNLVSKTKIKGSYTGGHDNRK